MKKEKKMCLAIWTNGNFEVQCNRQEGHEGFHAGQMGWSENNDD